MDVIRTRQLERLNRLLDEILPRNRFYAAKLDGLQVPVDWNTFQSLPLTTKAELAADQSAHPPFGSNLTYEPERYTTYHQTSGTTGRPLVILDTAESWAWWADCWTVVYQGAGVTARDRIFFAFSFGPFIGFWSAYAGAGALGALAIPGGGMDSTARLQTMARAGATVLVSTPTYALRLAEVARDAGLDLRALGIRVTIHAGEPGASIPAVRARIEDAWEARCFDHAGASEVGAYAYPCKEQALHVNEDEFIVEVLDPQSVRPVGAGGIGELVITNLGRPGWPVIRYRTGDLVRVSGCGCRCGRAHVTLPGGLIGRADDVMIVRGVNIYPSAIEAIIRAFPVDEFRVVRFRRDAMEELLVEVETHEQVAPKLAEAFRHQLGVRLETKAVPPGTLPRFELKGRRVIDRRG